MLTILRSDQVIEWLRNLQDLRGRAIIARRLLAAQQGNFGNCEPVGEGISEMKIDFGLGYRIYYTRAGAVVYLLLLAGTKRTQQHDIDLAKVMLKHLRFDAWRREAQTKPEPKPKTERK
jgi:putative addiction module killer protein